MNKELEEKFYKEICSQTKIERDSGIWMLILNWIDANCVPREEDNSISFDSLGKPLHSTQKILDIVSEEAHRLRNEPTGEWGEKEIGAGHFMLSELEWAVQDRFGYKTQVGKYVK